MSLNNDEISLLQIQKTVFNQYLRKSCFAVLPNVSYGLFAFGEADMIGLTKAGFLTEIEIKTSISDLKADFKKKKWNSFDWRKRIKNFYYAMPFELKEKALEELKKHPLGDSPGILFINKVTTKFVYNENYTYFNIIRFRNSLISNKEIEKITDSEKIKLLRLISLKYWDLKNRNNYVENI